MEFIVAVLLSYSNSKYFPFIFLNLFLVTFFFQLLFIILSLFFDLCPALVFTSTSNPPLLPPIVRGGFFYAP